MTGYDPTSFEDPRQAELLAALRTMAPLPLLAADAIGVPRDLVKSWLEHTKSKFCKELGKLRSDWVAAQVRILVDLDTPANQAAKIRWLLTRVDPETFGERARPKPPLKDARQHVHHTPAKPAVTPADLSKLEEPEP